MILADIGEVGVHVGNDVTILRPSLYAMTRIGPPAYIVEVYATVMAEGLAGRLSSAQLGCAFEVLMACTEENIEHLIGSYVLDEVVGGFKYVRGLIPPNEMILLAKCLVRHGVTGSVEPTPPEEGDDEPEGEYSSEFDARKHVANAVAHLGMSEKEAWNATMTSLVDALRAKFPPVRDPDGKKKTKPPTASEYDAAMEWADRIEAKRKIKLGIED